MSDKEKQQNSEEIPAAPAVETNFESRHRNSTVPLTTPDYGLQAEQFMACPQKTIIPPFNSAMKTENVREATMSLYNSLNASDHI